MISLLLPAIKIFLTKECAHLHLVSQEKDKDGNEIVRAPRVFIGDFPAKRERGFDTHEFPCILIIPQAGYAENGIEVMEIAIILAVYNDEENSAADSNKRAKGDASGLEMDLVLLYSAVSRALRKCLDIPLEERFNMERDEKGRILRWQRSGEPNTPRPYAQMVLVSRWTAHGWE